MPMTPFIGVRISWLIAARKSSLARPAATASCSLMARRVPWRCSFSASRTSIQSASRVAAAAAPTPPPRMKPEAAQRREGIRRGRRATSTTKVPWRVTAKLAMTSVPASSMPWKVPLSRRGRKSRNSQAPEWSWPMPSSLPSDRRQQLAVEGMQPDGDAEGLGIAAGHADEVVRVQQGDGRALEFAARAADGAGERDGPEPGLGDAAAAGAEEAPGLRRAEPERLAAEAQHAEPVAFADREVAQAIDRGPADPAGGIGDEHGADLGDVADAVRHLLGEARGGAALGLALRQVGQHEVDRLGGAGELVGQGGGDALRELLGIGQGIPLASFQDYTVNDDEAGRHQPDRGPEQQPGARLRRLGRAEAEGSADGGVQLGEGGHDGVPYCTLVAAFRDHCGSGMGPIRAEPAARPPGGEPAGAGSPQAPAPPAPAPPTALEAAPAGVLEAPPSAPVPPVERLAAIRGRGELAVCIWPEYFAISYRNPRNSELEGIDIDMARALANRLAVTLRFVETNFAEFIDRVESGACDVAMMGVGILPSRQERLAFTKPYLASAVYAVTTRESTPDRPLAGHRLGRHGGGGGGGDADGAADAADAEAGRAAGGAAAADPGGGGPVRPGRCLHERLSLYPADAAACTTGPG